jgi:hypothetical protein
VGAAFTEAIARIREKRLQQTEPEVRITLGRIINDAHLARAVPEATGLPAFDVTRN